MWFSPSKLLHPAVFLFLWTLWWLELDFKMNCEVSKTELSQSKFSLLWVKLQITCFPELGDIVSLYFSLPWPLPAFYTMDMLHHKFIHSPFKLILFLSQIQSLQFIKGPNALHCTRNLIYTLPTKPLIFHGCPANWIYPPGHCKQSIVNNVAFCHWWTKKFCCILLLCDQQSLIFSEHFFLLPRMR